MKNLPLSEIGKIVSRIKTWNPLRSGEMEPFDYIDLSSIDQSRKVIATTSRILPHEAPSRARQLVNQGDVLISTVRPNLNGVAYVPEGLEGATASTGFCVLRPKPKCLDGRYLFHWVQTSQFVSEMVKRSTGANYPAVSDHIVKTSKIPLPLLPEQKRIAAILDKADAIRRKRRRAIQLADDFLRATFLDMFGDPVTNPKGWEVKALGDFANIQIGPFGTQLHKEDYVNNGIPLINPSHIVGGILVPCKELTISEEKHLNLREYHLRPGDIIMGRRGEMGRCAIVSENENGWLCGTGSLYLRFEQRFIVPQYLFFLLSGRSTKIHLERESLGATLPNLNKGIVSKINVPVPPRKHQDKFLKVVEQFNKIIRKRALCVSDDQTVFNSLTQRAFRGDL